MLSLTVQPASVDIWFNSNNPTTNRYGTTTAYTGEHASLTAAVYRAIVGPFDISSIPKGSTILTATLSIYISADSADNNRYLRVYRLKVDWLPTQATWSIRKTGVPWTSGGAFDSNDCENTEIGNYYLSASPPNGWKDITLDTDAISEIVNGSFDNNGFLMKMDTEIDDNHGWYSSYYGTPTSRPKLYIEYELPKFAGGIDII